MCRYTGGLLALAAALEVCLGVFYKRFHWLSFLARQNTRDTNDTCELDFNPTAKTTNKLYNKLFDHTNMSTFC